MDMEEHMKPTKPHNPLHGIFDGLTLGLSPQPAPEAAPTYVHLKTCLARLSVHGRQVALAQYEEAIARGVLQAAVLKDERCSIRIAPGKGKGARRTLHDQIILQTPECDAWWAARGREAHMADLTAKGRAVTTLARIASGEDNFAQIAGLHQRLMAQQLKTRKQLS